jgi:glutamate racemase
MHLLLTDSGLGGLSICAALEATLRRSPDARGIRLQPDLRRSRDHLRLTYVNAWPEEGRGYNDLPDMAARAAMFDRALARIDAMAPDAILVACNTLSIVYEATGHHRSARIPVRGIVEAGVALFEEALRAHAAGALVLVGTRTTIDSGVHRERLLARGLAAGRVAGASCHGLATAIENGPHSRDTDARVEACAARASAAAPAGEPLLLGLCCTHYGMVVGRLREAVARASGRPVVALDPNERLMRDVAAWLIGGRAFAGDAGAARARRGEDRTVVPLPEPGARSLEPAIVEVVSKVALSEAKREAVAALVEAISPATARALRSYKHVPDLF